MSLYLYNMNVDVLALELAADDAGTLDAIQNFPEDKYLGMGVIDVLSREVDEPEKLVDRVNSVQRYVDSSRIILNPDCGFAPASENPISMDEAYLKLKTVARAADMLRDRFE